LNTQRYRPDGRERPGRSFSLLSHLYPCRVFDDWLVGRDIAANYSSTILECYSACTPKHSKSGSCRFCSLIPGMGVKLSANILAGPTVLSAVGAGPPHDGVRRRWRINVASAVAFSGARKESDDLTTATVPAGTFFPALSREPCDLPWCALRGSLLGRPVKLGAVDPHAVQNDRELASDSDFGLAEPVALDEPRPPSLERRPFRDTGQQHTGCFK
jgi:hypothetical protein